MTASTNQPEARTVRELLRHWFYAPLPTDRMITQSLQDFLGKLQREMLPLSGQPLGTILLNPPADREVLVALKNYGKRRAMLAGTSTAEYDAVLTLYFAAIASALVFRGENISAHSHVTLAAAFDTLSAKPWMVPELTDLLARAQAVCRQRQNPVSDGPNQ
jgi:hypothetical protein